MDRLTGMHRRLRALRVVHPFPSFLNSALVLALAFVAGADPLRALALAGGMLGLQFCIGATNDLVDRELDSRTKLWKPVASGLLAARTAGAIAALAAAAGLAGAAVGGPVTVVLWVLMLACGLAYDLRLKPTPWAWTCFSIAFVILPIYAWYGAAAAMPPRPEFLLPLAAVAGPAIQLSNGLVDLESDAAGGIRTLAARLGRERTLLVIALLLLVIHGLAWATLSSVGVAPNVILLAASGIAAIGFVLLTHGSTGWREAGWTLQAGSIALLGVGWLAAVA